MPLPPLPPLPSSWCSRVFGGQAPAQANVPNVHTNADGPLDTERLAFIGDAVVHIGVTAWLHARYPKHRNATLTSHMLHLKAKLENLLNKQPAEWAKLYKLSSYQIATATTSETKSNLISKGDLFRAYLAAVYLDKGGPCGGSVVTNEWMKGILDFEDSEEGNVRSDSDESSDESDEVRVTKTDEFSEMLNGLLGPPSRTPKRRPATQLPPASVNVQVSNSRNSLSLLNERATQKKVPLTWDDNSSGLDHAKSWVAKLTVANKEFTGTGHNKKLARGAAAEVALKGLNWVGTYSKIAL